MKLLRRSKTQQQACSWYLIGLPAIFAAAASSNRSQFHWFTLLLDVTSDTFMSKRWMWLHSTTNYYNNQLHQIFMSKNCWVCRCHFFRSVAENFFPRSPRGTRGGLKAWTFKPSSLHNQINFFFHIDNVFLLLKPQQDPLSWVACSFFIVVVAVVVCIFFRLERIFLFFFNQTDWKEAPWCPSPTCPSPTCMVPNARWHAFLRIDFR